MHDALIYNISGEKVSSVKLPTAIFGVEVSPELIHRVVVSRQANLRKSTAHTKTRGEVRGGGKKPWQQKGTGRARAGSIRSPIWRGGGITFGPRNERNYTQKINKKIQRQVLLMALSDKAINNRLVIVDNFNLAAEKTKEFAKLLKLLPIQNQKCLFAYQPSEIIIHRVAKNIASVATIPVQNINLRQLLDANYVLMSQATLNELSTKFKISNSK